MTAVADSMVRAQFADANYGSQSEMDVTSGGASKLDRSFVRFDVSSIPAGSTITSASLTLCVASIDAGNTYDVLRTTASWGQGTITWNNQPSVAGSATDSQTFGTTGCKTWTVTSDVQLWVDGTTNDGWRTTDQNETQNPSEMVAYKTRENATVAERPTLDVTYTSP